ncbi:MAG: alpha/beta hydrolase [Acidobacteria bacterium]|nr:alpha/beta hydrolase [Acidobacteriota bacterium]
MTRIRRWVIGSSIAVTGFFGLVEVLAGMNVRRERDARRALGDRLYVESLGTRDPIVFIAGLQASTRYWGSTFDPLGSSHRLLFVDMLGFGRSPWPDVDYGLDVQLEWLRRTLVAKGATHDVILVGHSFGAIIAAHYAARYPDDIRHVYLLGTPVYDSVDEARERIHDMSHLAALFALNPFLAREGCMGVCAFRPLWRVTLPYLRPDLPPEVAIDGVSHHWASIHGSIQHILLRTRVADAVKQIGRKVTFLHGRSDDVTAIGKVRGLAAATGATVIETPGGHHGYRTPLLRILATDPAVGRLRRQPVTE